MMVSILYMETRLVKENQQSHGSPHMCCISSSSSLVWEARNESYFSSSPKNASAKNDHSQRSRETDHWYGEEPKKERYSNKAGCQLEMESI